jgi:hypothetical protein
MSENTPGREAVEFDANLVPTIACVNRATVDLGINWEHLLTALDSYVNKIFSPVWGKRAKIIDLGDASDIPSGCWGLAFLDDSSIPGDLGEHDLTNDYLPLAKVFVKPTLGDHQKVEVIAGHEVVEMLVDPGIQMGALGPDGQCWFAYEVADPVESETIDVNGVAMSNFVYPAWFDAFRAPYSTKFDYNDSCHAPFQPARGGYIPVFVNGVWTNIFGSHEAAQGFNPARHQRAQMRPQRMWRNRIREAQRQLKDLGLYDWQIDGIEGKCTKKALEDYKAKYGPDHEITPGLLERLLTSLRRPTGFGAKIVWPAGQGDP